MLILWKMCEIISIGVSRLSCKNSGSLCKNSGSSDGPKELDRTTRFITCGLAWNKDKHDIRIEKPLKQYRIWFVYLDFHTPNDFSNANTFVFVFS